MNGESAFTTTPKVYPVMPMRYVKSLIASQSTERWCGSRYAVIGSWETVYPSGLASFAMLLGPIMPPPPGLLSTTTGWPRYFCATSANFRRWASVVPPAGQGQMSVIGLEGNACAAARSGAASSSAATASLPIEPMPLLLDDDYSHPSDR